MGTGRKLSPPPDGARHARPRPHVPSLKFGAGGLAGVGAGIWLVLHPDMGLPPSGRRTLDDYAPGIGAVGAGLLVLAFAWLLAFSRIGRR